jgi:multiple sugar transport system permease protein
MSITHPRLTASRREAITFYLTISPWLIGFVAFTLVPMAISLYLGFTRWDLFSSPRWVGLENYARMANDKLFWQALKVTTIYTLTYVPAEMIGGLSLALLVNQKMRGVGGFRTIFYLPSVLAGVAYVVLWMWIFNPQGGLLNTLLGYVGVQGPSWLIDPNLGAAIPPADDLLGLGAGDGDLPGRLAGCTIGALRSGGDRRRG